MATNDIYDGAYPEPSGTIPANYRYYRITFNGAWYDDMIKISNIEGFYSSSAITPTTVTSSGDISGYPVANAHDGSSVTFWYGDIGSWLKFDYGASQNIDWFNFSSESGSTVSADRHRPYKITIEGSADDSIWVELGKVRIGITSQGSYYFNVDGSSPERTVTVTSDTSGDDGYRYYKFQVLRRNNTRIATTPNDPKINEIYFYSANGRVAPIDDDYFGYASGNEQYAYDENLTNTWLARYYTVSGVGASCYASGLFDFGRRVELVGINLTVDGTATDTQPVAWKLYGTNDGTTYDLLQYVNDYQWPLNGTYDSAYFPIDVTTGGVYSASGFVIRNGSPVQANVHFYNATSKELIYSTSSSAIDGSWTYNSGTNAPILVVVEGEESEGYQIQGEITPT